MATGYDAASTFIYTASRHPPTNLPLYDASIILHHMCIKATECAVCSKPAPHHCSRCKVVGYCSKACQRQHWPTHKAGCKPEPPARDELPRLYIDEWQSALAFINQRNHISMLSFSPPFSQLADTLVVAATSVPGMRYPSRRTRHLVNEDIEAFLAKHIDPLAKKYSLEMRHCPLNPSCPADGLASCTACGRTRTSHCGGARQRYCNCPSPPAVFVFHGGTVNGGTLYLTCTHVTQLFL